MSQIYQKGFNMGESLKDKYIWTTKVSGKGQIVIPSEARKIFNINTGENLILFVDKNQGIAIAKYDNYVKFAEAIFNAKNNKK